MRRSAGRVCEWGGDRKRIRKPRRASGRSRRHDHRDHCRTAVGGDRGAAALPDSSEQPAPADGDPRIAQGKALYASKGCIGCHSLNSIGQPKRTVGPNLAGIGTRKMIAGGWLANTDANLKHWIMKPQEVKPGVQMQVPPMTDAEADAIVAYLRTKR